jgi:hypothetical protein
MHTLFQAIEINAKWRQSYISVTNLIAVLRINILLLRASALLYHQSILHYNIVL